MTKAGLLEKKGDPKAASELRQAALTKATEVELNQYGYQLLGAKKVDEALKIFERNTKEHPESWNVWDSLADGWVAAGNKKNAFANYEKALTLTTDEDQKTRIKKELGKLK
jgi:predicted Zn-dependent protease